eukprot:729985_1
MVRSRFNAITIQNQLLFANCFARSFVVRAVSCILSDLCFNSDSFWPRSFALEKALVITLLLLVFCLFPLFLVLLLNMELTYLPYLRPVFFLPSLINLTLSLFVG